MLMRRETTNFIRFLFEDVLPPVLRDTALFRWATERVWGEEHMKNLVHFRHNAPFLTEQEYEDLYKKHPRVHEGTDNSDACVKQIVQDVVGESICDVGCGTGYVLRHIKGHSRAPLKRFVGVDFVLHGDADVHGIEFFASKVETLPFKDREFDTVICTHLVEHILDYRAAIAELRRITNKRLIIVVPREREGLYTFNPHFNFYPYPHSFVRAMTPVPENYECKLIGRDIYYREDRV